MNQLLHLSPTSSLMTTTQQQKKHGLPSHDEKWKTVEADSYGTW